jgi:hypothetical protein
LPGSALEAVGPAFQHTKQQLLQPFRAGQWARLGLVGLLAGELTTGSCGHFGRTAQTPGRSNPAPTLPHIDPLLLALLVSMVLVLGFVFWIVLLYVSSVMRFILFDGVLAKRCEIRNAWNRRQGPGLRYFVWHILFILAMAVGFIILIGIPVVLALASGWLAKPKEHMVPLIFCGALLFVVVLGFGLLVAVVHVLTKDFVVPQMALENLSAFQAWKRLLPMLNAEVGPYCGYLLLKVFMTLAVGIIVGIISTVVILIALIPVGGLGALFFLAGKAAGVGWNAGTITLVVVAGCALLAGILYVISLVSVPAMVFFPAYSIYFFASRYPLLEAMLHPQAPIPSPSPLAPSRPEATG